jgi:hypothetical protein
MVEEIASQIFSFRPQVKSDQMNMSILKSIGHTWHTNMLKVNWLSVPFFFEIPSQILLKMEVSECIST